MDPLVMKLKGIMPLNHDIAIPTAQRQMVDAIRVFGADSLGAWSGTFGEFITAISSRSVFVRRLRAFERSERKLCRLFGRIEWHNASVQLIYTYKYGAKHTRTGINFGHVIKGTIVKTGEPICFTYRQYPSAISGTRWFKIANYKQTKMSELEAYQTTSWKKRNNYVAKPTNSAIMVP